MYFYVLSLLSSVKGTLIDNMMMMMKRNYYGILPFSFICHYFSLRGGEGKGGGEVMTPPLCGKYFYLFFQKLPKEGKFVSFCRNSEGPVCCKKYTRNSVVSEALHHHGVCGLPLPLKSHPHVVLCNRILQGGGGRLPLDLKLSMKWGDLSLSLSLSG